MRTLLLSSAILCSLLSHASAASLCPSPEQIKTTFESTVKDRQYATDWKRIFTQAVTKALSTKNQEVTGFYTGTAVADKVSIPDLDVVSTQPTKAFVHCTYTVKGHPNDVVLKLQILMRTN